MSGEAGKSAPRLRFVPATPSRWPDLVELFGSRGACGGCWCMWWRLGRSDFNRERGPGNRRALRRLVASGHPPGLLAYRGERAVGWCAVAPREAYPALDRSRILAKVDDQPVWSVSCLFVAKPFRRHGISVSLLKAAVQHAERGGARLVEGYPVEPRPGQRMPDAFAWTGTASAFEKAGFEEVARRSPTRPIMRSATRRSRRNSRR